MSYGNSKKWIAPVVRDALARLAEALDPEPAFEPRASQRRFRGGMTDAGELVFVPKIVSALAQRAPGVRIEIVPLAFEPLAAALADGTLDAAVGPLIIGLRHTRKLSPNDSITPTQGAPHEPATPPTCETTPDPPDDADGRARWRPPRIPPCPATRRSGRKTSDAAPTLAR